MWLQTTKHCNLLQEAKSPSDESLQGLESLIPMPIRTRRAPRITPRNQFKSM